MHTKEQEKQYLILAILVFYYAKYNEQRCNNNKMSEEKPRTKQNDIQNAGTIAFWPF